MKKIVLFATVAFLLTNSNLLNAQTVFVDGNSSTRKFIGQEPEFNFYRDWSYQATFTSGLGEYVKFFPTEIKNLRTNEKIKALQLEMMVKTENLGSNMVATISTLGMKKKEETNTSAFVGYDEVEGFISFLEKNVIPNLGTKLNSKSNEYIFKSKEMVFSYLIYEKERRITIGCPIIDEATGRSTGKFLYFWTERNIDDVKDLVKVLKRLKENS
jgi:hypothetical protein